jgi:hypothetical protein
VVAALFLSLFSENLIQCSKEDSLIMHACWFLLLAYDKKDGRWKNDCQKEEKVTFVSIQNYYFITR